MLYGQEPTAQYFTLAPAAVPRLKMQVLLLQSCFEKQRHATTIAGLAEHILHWWKSESESVLVMLRGRWFRPQASAIGYHRTPSQQLFAHLFSIANTALKQAMSSLLPIDS